MISCFFYRKLKRFMTLTKTESVSGLHNLRFKNKIIHGITSSTDRYFDPIRLINQGSKGKLHQLPAILTIDINLSHSEMMSGIL
jgi:hypothetical protein